MLSVVLATVRSRWTHFAGVFLAVALGVGLTASMGLALAATLDAPQELKDRDAEAVFTVNAMLGTAAAVTTFTSVFVVSSAFAFAVAQRQREFGLLRSAGATGRQLRVAVVAEAALVAVPAAVLGCLIGSAGGPALVEWMAREGLAPDWLTVEARVWPYAVAFGTGLVVALTGAFVASGRAAKTSAVEVLREAAVDKRVMTVGRWLFGGLLLALGVGLLVSKLVSDPADLLKRKTYTTQPMVLIGAFALLTPLAAGPLVRLVAWPAARMRGAVGMLVRESAAAGVRRTSALAAPVLVSVALAGSLLGSTDTVGAGRADEVRSRTAADFVVTSDAGLSDAAVAAAAVPGTRSAVSAATTVEFLYEGLVRTPEPARVVDPAAFAELSRLPLVEGSVKDLDDTSIVVNDEWPVTAVGQPVEVWRADGTKVSLTVAAVMRRGTGGNGAYVTAANGAGARPDRVEVRLEPGADRAAVAASLAAAVGAQGARVVTAEEWIAASQPETKRESRLAIFVVLGLALLYSLIALAGTMVSATSDRSRDLAVLRLSGATGGQVLRLVAVEAAVVVVAGALLGVLVTALNVLGTWSALSVLVGSAAPLSLPWGAMAAVAASCAAVAVPAAVLSAAVLLRGRVAPGAA
ncbi:ABC transporter permease (plasmid) [Streptomyces sp. NBC_00335]|uniref:ABC transporter permease n=1 Tax=unclassified Streptomyces TaxID=2593676 RepID=UPI0022544355|nr:MULTISPECIES: ABC transporter permease [unclassified Streptomyces]MCX5410120.1 ABC transporter permease [Streptomyces sp. NBC_00086]